MRFSPILILFVLGSCSSGRDENLRIGDLTFDIWRMSSFYNLPDSIIRKIGSGMDTVTSDFTGDKDESFIEIFNRLKNQSLLYKPFVDIRVTEDSVITLYLDSADYDRIKIHTRKELQSNHKKLVIYGRTRKIDERGSLLYCTDLTDVKLVDGETYPIGRSKFKIEDYE